MTYTQPPSLAPPASAGAPAAPVQIAIRWDRIPWEPLLYAALFIVALGMRLWDLDARAYHYDESIHAYDSWALFQGRGYAHSPWSHGPFMYEVQAGGFFLFGDSLFAARVFPALFGSALVLMPLLLRGRLGRGGALAASALLAFSPALLYVSRFAREDIYAVVFDLGLVVALWRYIDTRRTRWLYFGAISLVLSFSTKETAYLSLVAVGSFLAAWWARRWLPVLWSRASNKGARLLARLRPSRLRPEHFFLVFVAALTLPLASAGIGFVIERIAPGDLVLVRPQEPGLGAGLVGAPHGGAPAYAVAALIAATLFVASVILGLLLRHKAFFTAFGAFWAIFFVLHTTFLTNMIGMGTGLWQGLGYWISQHPVERAGQPWYYYFMLLALYEFLPFLFGIGALLLLAWKRGRRFAWWALGITVAAGLLAPMIYLGTDQKFVYLLLPLGGGLMLVTYLALAKGDPFEWFLVHWTLITLLLYVVAGEKMPWLLTHLTLPFALLAGRSLGRLLDAIQWRKAVRHGGVLLLFVVPAAALLAIALDKGVPWRGAPAHVWTVAGPSVAAAALAAGAVIIWRRVGARRAAGLAGVSLLAFMAFFTIRAGVQVTYANDDDAREMIVYSQVGAEIPRIVERIDRLARESGKGRELKIQADTSDAALAPWRWYLRNYTGASLIDMTTYQGDFTADVVILGERNKSKINAARARYTEGEQVHLLEWFNPWVYQRYTAGKFWDDVRSGASWKRLRQYFVYREMKTQPAFQDVVVYFAKGAP